MTPRSLPTRSLREHPDINQLKRQAKELLASFRAGDAAATGEVTAHYRGADATTFALHDAQLVIARAYGFDSWSKLKAYVDGVSIAGLAGAVQAGDIATVRAMLGARPELVHMNMSEHNEHQVLHYAVLNRNPDMVRLLMEQGADPHKGIWPHRPATTALTIATERRYDDIVAIINEALHRRQEAVEEPNRADGIDQSSSVLTRMWSAWGTPTEAADEAVIIACLEEDPRLIHWHRGDGWTPLHQASLALLLDVARWLVAHGADVNAHEPCYWTPLELVGRFRKNFTPEKAAKMVELLKSHGAKMTGASAITLGDAEWLRARHAEGTLTEPKGPYGLVSRAAIAGRADMLTLLLDLGFDPDERHRGEGLEEVVYSWGEPLRTCAIGDKAALAEILLLRGADPNPSIYAASTPMFEAYARGHHDVIAALERHGGVADFSIVGNFGLIDQARQMIAKDPTAAASLIDSGASGGQLEIVRLALEHLDWPPGDLRWHWNLMRLLGAHPEADRGRYLKCFALMVDRSGPNAPGPYGRVILHDVCAGWPRNEATPEERLAFATILLDRGARLDVRDDLLQSTPLGWACRWGRAELVRLFLDRAADPSEPEAAPWATPRAWAEKMEHKEIVPLLEAHRGESDV